MNNVDVRSAIRKAGLHNWMVAEMLGVSESYLSRMLRHELDEEKKQAIYKAIERLKAGESH